ncbi:bacterial Ig-like domain-containing protein [Hungatella effluvii]|uniref:bacterial Ig-like domain-containing protein n=1 Tax=Hungatella effluvii TaxID=1096246 RepID=UPI0022E0D8C9|nr:bacterial Ig-like domain-containing protein [Hungatella effluvii]
MKKNICIKSLIAGMFLVLISATCTFGEVSNVNDQGAKAVYEELFKENTEKQDVTIVPAAEGDAAPVVIARLDNNKLAYMVSGEPFYPRALETGWWDTRIPDPATGNETFRTDTDWDYVFKDMSDIGANTVQLMVYWSDWEPRQGVYDYSFLDGLINKASEYGLKTELIIFFHSHAISGVIPRSQDDFWAYHLDDRDGKCHTIQWGTGSLNNTAAFRKAAAPGNGQEIFLEYWHPQVYSKLMAALTDLAAHYADSPNVIGYQVGNEEGFNYYVNGGMDQNPYYETMKNLYLADNPGKTERDFRIAMVNHLWTGMNNAIHEGDAFKPTTSNLQTGNTEINGMAYNPNDGSTMAFYENLDMIGSMFYGSSGSIYKNLDKQYNGGEATNPNYATSFPLLFPTEIGANVNNSHVLNVISSETMARGGQGFGVYCYGELYQNSKDYKNSEPKPSRGHTQNLFAAVEKYEDVIWAGVPVMRQTTQNVYMTASDANNPTLAVLEQDAGHALGLLYFTGSMGANVNEEDRSRNVEVTVKEAGDYRVEVQLTSGKDASVQMNMNIPAGGSFSVPVKTVNITTALISVTKIQEQVKSYGITGHVTGEMGEAAQDIAVNLYKGIDISAASPSNAVKTDAEGRYGFQDLPVGVYSVELPAQNGCRQEVKTVVINGTDVEAVDFQLVKAEEEQADRKLKIKTLPAKTKYWIGEQLDLTGMEVSIYKDGVEERQLDADEYTAGELDSSKTGTQKIPVTYTDGSADESVEYETSFTVTVYERKLNQSIKVVKKPDQLVYTTGEELNPEGLEVRGLNLTDEKVTVLKEGDYKLEYDTSKAGTAAVTVICSMEEGDAPAVVLKDSFDIRVFDGDEARQFAEQIDVIQKPYKLTYEPGEEFDPEGMIVEKTVKVLASPSNAVYKERVPLESLEMEIPDLSKPGNRKVKVLYYGEDGDGKEAVFSDSFSVKVSKSKDTLLTGTLSTIQKRLEQSLQCGEYLTESEKQAAFNRAIEDAGECLEAYGENGGVSDKTYSKLLFLDRMVTEAYPDIKAAVNADGIFKNVSAQGLILSADFSLGQFQQIRLDVEKTRAEEEVSEIAGELENPLAVDISLITNGGEIQPVLPIRLRMQIPEGLSKKGLVIYQYHDGEWSAITPAVKGNQMSFLISDLSLFVIGNSKDRTSQPSTGSSDNGSSVWKPANTIPGVWKQDDTGWWYQKNSGGYVTSSWAQIDGLWYYFDETGYMKTDWVTDNGIWYFMNQDGSMAVSRWVLWDGQWYYLGWNGAMAVNTVTPDGYVVDEDGVWVK